MSASNLPAGLLDNRIEFFGVDDQPDICYALTNGRVFRVNDLPADTKALIWVDINAHTKKLQQLVALGYDGDALLEKYCRCCFGLYDGNPDFADGVFYHNEYVPVPETERPENQVLYNPLVVGTGRRLTHRQTAVLRLIGRRMLNKEIAGHLNISPETVKIHVKNIQRLSGTMNKMDLVSLAHQKQLV